MYTILRALSLGLLCPFMLLIGCAAQTISACAPGDADIRGSQAAILADGTLYMGGQFGHLYAVDASTGRMRWSVVLSGAAGTPVVESNVLYVTTSVALYALSNVNGATLWQVQLSANPEGELLSPPLLVDQGVVYVAYSTMGVEAFDGHDGKLLWQSANMYQQTIGLAIAQQHLIVAGTHLSALNAQTGQRLWQTHDGPSTEYLIPHIVQRTIIVSSRPTDADPGVVAAYDVTSGTMVWQQQLPGTSPTSVALNHDMVVVGSNQPSDANSASSTITLLKQEDGIIITSAILPYVFTKGDFTPPFIDNSQIIVGGFTGIVSAFTYENAAVNVLWQHRFLQRPLTVDDKEAGLIYVSAGSYLNVSIARSGACSVTAQRIDGTLLAINASDGTLVWQDVFADGAQHM